MEDITTTNDADYDRRLHSLRRMGFECWTRLDNPTSFPDIRDYRSDDRQFRHLDERRTLQRKRGRQMISYMLKYLKRIWCAVLNKKCHDECDCTIKKD
tara:strand:+ start:244 stop:537 length:294 start_codon:yes stop_codon:yes gene_type:complete